MRLLSGPAAGVEGVVVFCHDQHSTVRVEYKLGTFWLVGLFEPAELAVLGGPSTPSVGFDNTLPGGG